jgi:broad specificity phosphatase PhoE
MPTILLIRHAQASYGAADYDVLSPLAERQIAALGTALVRRGLEDARVVSGPARRQRETAVLGALGREPVLDARWAEYRTDEVLATHAETPARLEGDGTPPMSSRDFQNLLDPALERWIAAGAAGASAQPWTDFLGAVTAATRELAADLSSGETALVFSSAGAIAAVCAALLGQPAGCFVALNRVQVNTGISKLAIGRSGTTLVSFNDHSHLDDVDPALVTYR